MAHPHGRLFAIMLGGLAAGGIIFAATFLLNRDRPDDAPRLVAAGVFAHESGDFVAAMKFFNRAVACAPDHLIARFARGNAHYGVDDLESALLDYDHIIRLAPHDVETRYRRAKSLLGLRREEEMFEEIEALLTISPNHGEARRLCAWVRFNRREYELSLRDLDLLVEDKALRGGAALGEVLPLRAEVRLSLGDDVGALTDLERLLEMDATDSEARRTMMWALWGLQRYDEALQLLDEAIADDPQSVTLLFARALTLMHLARDDEALAILIEIRSSGRSVPPEADFFLWVAHWRAGEVEEAKHGLPSDEAFTRWHVLIARFLRGELGESELLEVAGAEGGSDSPAQRQCEAFYYAGMKRLCGGDVAGARNLLQQSVATNQRRYYEFHAAVAELERMRRAGAGL